MRVEGRRERGASHSLQLTHVRTHLSIATSSAGYMQAMPALLTTATRDRGTGARAARSCCTWV